MLWLQILLPILFAACLLAGRATLKQWGHASLLTEAAFLLPVGIFFIYLYTGIIVKDPFAPQARLFFEQSLLRNPPVLAVLCMVLFGVLLALIWLGIRSETLSFILNIEADVTVEHLRNGHTNFLGYASRNQPLTRRFRTGQHQFRFSAPDFVPQEQSVFVHSRNWSNAERRIPITLLSVPVFFLRDFQGFSADFFGSLENFHVPAHLKDHDSLQVAFTIAGDSVTPMWIQNLALRVVEAKPLKMATFPLEGLGGDGAEPVLGRVELKPQPGCYPVVAERKIQPGKDIAPDDYRLLVLSPKGYEYSVQVELLWADMQDQRRTGRHTFEETLSLGFPNVVRWEELVRGASELKILYDESLYLVLPAILFEQPPPRYQALISPRGSERDLAETKALPNTAVVSHDEAEPLYAMLESEKHEYPPSFILIDGRILLLLSARHFPLAYTIEDPQRIAAIESAFDSLTDKLLA